MRRYTEADIPRLLAERRQITDSGCWEWTGTILKTGYGVLSILGRYHSVHRLAAKQIHGALKPTELVCHHCDNRRCINPDHLYVGSYLDNSHDAIRRGRNARGETQGHSRLTADLIQEIRRSPESQHAIARRLGVSRGAISMVRTRRTWAWLT